MCPNLNAAYLYVVLFGLTTIAHIVQMFWHRKWYCWVIVVSAGMQTAAYVMRTLSIRYVANAGYYTYWFVLMMVRFTDTACEMIAPFAGLTLLIDRSSVDKRLRLHGMRAHGVQLYGERLCFQDQSLAFRTHFRPA